MTAELQPGQSIHGLKKDCLSYKEVIAQSFAVIAPTTVPSTVLGLIYASSGTGTWLSFLLGMIGLLFVGININQFARRSVSPGSIDFLRESRRECKFPVDDGSNQMKP